MARIAQRLEVRETLLDCTECLFRRYGYKKTTIEDIAQEARVSRATVYLYFKCKEEIAMAWLERHKLRLHADLKQIARQPATPSEKLRKILFTRVLSRFQVCQP